jgi:hypothetical protein
MQRISSTSTFFYKRVFPVLWFGFVAIFFAVFFFGKPARGAAIPFFIMPVFMAAIGYVIMKKMIFNLADDVFDTGDALIVRFGSEQESVPLSEIININYMYLQNPNRVTLTLRTPSRFGKEVSFMPPTRFVPFAKSPVVAQLIERVDAARRSGS